MAASEPDQEFLYDKKNENDQYGIQRLFQNIFFDILSEAYSEPSRTSTIEPFHENG